MKVLKSRLLEAKRQEQTDAMAQERKTQVGTGDRSERIRTYNYPQGRLTDHRIGQNLNVWTVIDGDMDDLINMLVAHDQQLKLEKLAEIDE